MEEGVRGVATRITRLRDPSRGITSGGSSTVRWCGVRSGPMVHCASILPLAETSTGRVGAVTSTMISETNTESDVGPSGRGSSRKVSVDSVPNVQQPYSSRALHPASRYGAALPLSVKSMTWPI